MASTVSNGNDRSEKWQRPFTKGKFATPSLGIEPGPHWWEASALTRTASSPLPTAPENMPEILLSFLERNKKRFTDYLFKSGAHCALQGPGYVESFWAPVIQRLDNIRATFKWP